MTDGFPAPTVVDRATLQRLLTLPDVAPGAYAAAQAEEAVTGADLVVTTTAARTPALHGDWLADDAVVVVIGADSPGKREWDQAVLTRGPGRRLRRPVHLGR